MEKGDRTAVVKCAAIWSDLSAISDAESVVPSESAFMAAAA